MDKDRGFSFDQEEEESEPSSGESAPRARNRTVMLTPEITGEVRARLAKDLNRPSAQIPAATGGQPSATPTHPDQSSFAAPRAVRELVADPTPAAPPTKTRSTSGEEHVVWSKESPLVGILVSYDVNPNGTIFELRSGRIIVTSEGATASGNFLVIRDETVSPMHAIIRISQRGEVQVLDQLSEHGTKITRFGSNEIEELSGDKGTVEHGDLIQFGKRKFHVCLIARG